MTQPSSAPQGGSGGSSDTEVADAERSAQEQGPVIRDRRRLDPQTGQVRAAYAATEPQPADAGQAAVDQVTLEGPDAVAVAIAAATTASGELEAARALADERLNDLQRLQAEYVNYRRRVERDRDVARDQAVASVLEALLPVLDDLHLARQHGDLEGGPFAAIAEKIEATLSRFGLARYGEPGETFDPTVHEALLHTQAELAEGTTQTTVVQILQPGYRAGERVLRAARVAVADPQ
jgi:molecular chaperone GrpE